MAGLLRGILFSVIEGSTMKRKISIALILVMLLTLPVSAATDYGTKWSGKYKTPRKYFRAYMDYTWEPDYSPTQARLTISGFGIQCLSKTKKFKLPAKSEKTAAVSVNVQPVNGAAYVSVTKNGKVKFPNKKKNAKAKFGEVTWIFNKTRTSQNLKVTYTAAKGKQKGKRLKKAYRKAFKGSSIGTLDLTIPAKPSYVDNGLVFCLPANSRTATATATVTNAAGNTLSYTMFNQTSGFPEYSNYLDEHGCSTCALTTILNTMNDLQLTPDQTMNILMETNPQEFAVNMASKQMPVALSGICKVLDAYDVQYRYGSNNAPEETKVAEVTEWLNTGNPVIMTIGNGSAGGLSSVPHTLLLLGIDSNGYVVIGDSVLKSASTWGTQGLVKSSRLTVPDMLSYIKTDSWNVASGSFYYSSANSRGYVLVGPKKDKPEPEEPTPEEPVQEEGSGQEG